MNYRKIKRIALFYAGATKLRDFGELAYSYINQVNQDNRSIRELENALYLNSLDQRNLNQELYKTINDLSNAQKAKKDYLKVVYKSNSEPKQYHLDHLYKLDRKIDTYKNDIMQNQYSKEQLEEDKKYLLFAYCYRSCVKNGKLDTVELKNILTDLVESKINQEER